MIKLDLKNYCHHGCMDFEPVVVKELCDIYIRCENAKRCEYMVRYLTRHAKEDVDDND